MSVVVFEDSLVNQLSPVVTGRLAATITCGSFRLVDLMAEINQPVYSLCRDYLSAIQRHDFPELQSLASVPDAAAHPRLLLSSALVPDQNTSRSIGVLLALPTDQTVIVKDRQRIVAIVNPRITFAELQKIGSNEIDETLASISEQPNSKIDETIRLSSFHLPHEIVAANMNCITESLEYRIASGRYQQLSDGVFVSDGVDIGEYVLFETTDGPIVIEPGATVGPYTLLRGPIHIGAKCKILEHAAIKDMVSLGHTTKIGGEVEAAVIEPYSNKQHHGFLGHSYLGSWINLGAGTCNSDLKNTYGVVNMEYGSQKVSTNMQFLGCIMGDYSKSAINTGIFTGKVIGVCSMMYGFVTSNVPSFVNYARLFGQLATLPPEVMVATQKRMFSRRKVEQRDCDIQLMHDMYRLTQTERDRFGDAIYS